MTRSDRMTLGTAGFILAIIILALVAIFAPEKLLP